MVELIEFDTERLRLRQWLATDRSPFAALNSDPKVMEFFPAPLESKASDPCVEIGWRLAFSYWGKGFASEAARGALRVGFELLNLPEIVSFTAVHNLRSRAVMERLGMRESNDTFDHPNVPEGSRLRQHCLYRLSGTPCH